jgi:hypothetical protein
MPIDFPDSPTNGNIFYVGGKAWEYNNGKWLLLPGGSLVGIYSQAKIDGGLHDTLVEAQVLDLDSSQTLDGGTA